MAKSLCVLNDGDFPRHRVHKHKRLGSDAISGEAVLGKNYEPLSTTVDSSALWWLREKLIM